MKKALFLDRDGILNEVIVRNGNVSSPQSLSEFVIVEDASKLVECARRNEYLIIVVTNQPDVGRKRLSGEELEGMHKLIQTRFSPDDIQVCTSANDSDPRRKPNPGMLFDAAKKFDIDLNVSIFVGDSSKDTRAGKLAGVTTILLKTPYNESSHGEADYEYESLHEICRHVENNGKM